MNKYLAFGLFMIIGANSVFLGEVLVNYTKNPRMLTLSERELTLSNNNGSIFDKSVSYFSFVWRVPTSVSKYNDNYSKDIKTTSSELVALGFKKPNKKSNISGNYIELYWAMEFDGQAYDDEVEKLKKLYLLAISNYEKDKTGVNERKIDRYKSALDKEIKVNSRLFYLDSSSSLEVLSSKFKNKSNVIIASGVTSYYYSADEGSYFLSLGELLIEKVTIPQEYYRDILAETQSPYEKEVVKYSAKIGWGRLLHPWVVSVER